MRSRALAFVAFASVVVTAAAGSAVASNDPRFAEQWGLEQIGAPAAWPTTTGAGVRIGIVDTGVDLTHEDLAGKVVAHTSCIGSLGDPANCSGSGQDDQGHGTHVSGIAAASTGNGLGIAGVAPDAQLVVAKALNAQGGGTVDDINAGIKWVVDHGAQVVNLSLGDPNFLLTSLLGSSMRTGIEYAWAHGAVPVLASGNTNLLGLGLGSSNYGDLNAVVVGATGPDGEVSSYSSPLGNAKWGILAPGGAGGGDGDPATDILSTYWQKDKANEYKAFAGTSMAAPHVSGAIALLLAEGLPADQAVARLLETSTPQPDCDSACGRLDTAQAVQQTR